VERLQTHFPSHSIVAEEAAGAGSSDACWYVDPLDGTTNSAHGFPVYKSRWRWSGRGLVAGCIYDPTPGDVCGRAWRGSLAE